MPLVDPLPKPLEERLATVVKSGELAAAVATDLDIAGLFSEEWLVLTSARLRVYVSNGHGFEPRLNLELEAIKTINVDGLVGGGALLVTIDGRTMEVIRYSNAQQRKFGRVAKYITDVRRYQAEREKTGTGGGETLDGKRVDAVAEPPRLEPDKEDQKRCPTCKLLLPEGSQVC